MVFASIHEHAEHCDFFASTSRDKKICFASSEQFREYNSRTASTSYIFRLQQSIWNFFFFKVKQNILKRGFNLERTKFFEASLSDTLSRSNQLLQSCHIFASLHHARVRTDQKAKVTRRTTVYNKHIYNNYSPKWRWLGLDIYLTASQFGKYHH